MIPSLTTLTSYSLLWDGALEEAVFVDDSSVDDSSILLDRLQDEHDWVKVIHLSRNYGQHPATIAGILHSSGEWVVTLDEDLQHPPALIEELLAAVAAHGHDLVYAKPVGPVHGRANRDLTSRLYKRMMARLAGNPHIPEFNSFRLIRGSIARAAASVCGHETYLDMALSWFTTRIGALEMPLTDHRVISGGASGYSIRSLISHARRMAVSSPTKALRWGAAIGLITMLVAAVYASFIVIQKILAPEAIPITGWTSLFVSILFFGGIISFLIGAILEYISVILLHVQGKPTFFVVDRSNDVLIAEYFAGRKG
jgi:glycosyltransferase involved in cell wall biosynthesis